MLGAAPFGEPITFVGQVRNKAGEYGLDLEAKNLPQGLAIDSVSIAIWGTPWSVAHDGQRGDCLRETDPAHPWAKCSTGQPKSNRPQPFLTLPNSCASPLHYAVSADSWQQPGVWVGDNALSTDAQGRPLGMQRCDRVGFGTTSFSQPTVRRASTATGFNFNLSVNQEGLLNPEGIAGSQIREAVVGLPEGFTINPSMGAGLGVCTPAQFAAETPTSQPGQGCPNNSNIGEFTVQSPLVVEPSTSFEQLIEGSIYLAQPDNRATDAPGVENPFDTLIAFYLVARAPKNGILVKVPGELIPNQKTGQLTAVFQELPQIPYTNLHIHFREGQRAPLATPATCGNYVTTVQLTPWLSTAQVLHQNFQFAVNQGIGGAPCPSGRPPFSPGAEDGSVNSNAGSYSPFYLHLTRDDTQQEITSYSATLPKGLLGKIAGIPNCPDSALAAARANTGIGELEHPSCPASSEIGHTVAGYGLGNVLTYAPGKLYLTGPYHGAPLSITAVDSALVGPFDLGVIIVRSAIEIDPFTAQVSIDSRASDPIPHIVGGIPLHLRDIRVYISRPNFTINPTNCAPSFATSILTGSSPPFANPKETTTAVDNFFQITNCAALEFKPKLSLKLIGPTRHNGYPKLRAELRERPGDANVGRAAVALPHAEFLAQEHIDTTCAKRLFEAHACPPGSVYGHARVFSPLIEEPWEGPVYLVSGLNGHLLPDMVVSLKGKDGLEIDLDARVDSIRGGMRATFESLPDAPASRFVLTLFGGKRGLLVNSATDLCRSKAPFTASVRFVGQNNTGYAPVVPLKNQCGKHGGKHHGKRPGHHRKNVKHHRKRGGK
jgi:hypothetical protein